ncbi:MAG: response regulator [Bacteroidales bacterium]
MMLKNSKILIVDDVPGNIQIVAATLQEAGYDISFAQNGPRALDMCEMHDYDLILLDIMMPGMDGIEVCKRLKARKEFEDMPIIFLTAKSDTDSITKAFEAGGVDYVTKPFKSAELLARVKSHLTIRHQKKELQELNATKDRFFSIIGHDLKGPFTGLLGFTELLIEESAETPAEELQNYYQLMYQSAKQGYELLTNLLEWSRTQSGKISFNPEPVNIKDIIEENIYILENLALKKQIDISIGKETDVEITADRNMLKTMMRNLISNAIKFTPENGKISVNAGLNDHSVDISVSDTGVGLDEEKVSRLFKVDQNISTKGTNQESGTGLGLIICKEFAEKHKGTLSVKSKKDQGSTFIISLPLKPED